MGPGPRQAWARQRPLCSALSAPLRLPSLLVCLQLSCDTASAPWRCPRVELWSWDAGRAVAGFGLDGTWATTWGEGGEWRDSILGA